MNILLRRTNNYFLNFFYFFLFIKFIASVLLLNSMLMRTFYGRLTDSIFKTDRSVNKTNSKTFQFKFANFDCIATGKIFCPNILYIRQPILLLKNLSFCLRSIMYFKKAATKGVLLKMVFLKISQNSQENTCARVCLKRYSDTGAYLGILRNFQTHHFYRARLLRCKEGIIH